METIRQRPRIKIEDILVAHPKKRLMWLGKKPSIEDTGRGDTLCCEKWGCRFFYSDEGAVREAVDKFVDDYIEKCQRALDDPAGEYSDVTNFNELYSLLGILPSPLGDSWGYSTSEGYTVNLDFKVDYVYPTEDEIADAFGCQILMIEPYDTNCYPDFYYREY